MGCWCIEYKAIAGFSAKYNLINKLSSYESIFYVTLPSSKLGYSRIPTCSMGTRRHHSFDLFPADICTTICPQGPPQEDVLCLMVSSLLGKVKGCPIERIVRFERQSNCRETANGCMHQPKGMLATVLRIPKLLGTSRGVHLEIYTTKYKGILSVGTLSSVPIYVVHRRV